MRRSLLGLALLAALAALLLAAGPAAATGAPQPVATLPYGDFGSFAESMTADHCGNLYASLTLWGNMDPVTDNVGQIWKIRPAGSATLVAEQNITPYGMLTGIVRDCVGRLYVGDVDFSGESGSLIYRVGHDGSWTPVAQLEPGTFPNGLALHDGSLYVSDCALGAIWRVRLGYGLATPTAPWIQSDLLAPGDPEQDPSALGLGINGIAFRGCSLYGVVSDFGRLVRISVGRHGVARTPTVVCESPDLRTADGVAFDLYGRLWVTTNAGPTADEPDGALFRVSPSGDVRQIAVDPSAFDYPTQPVFGTTLATCTTLFIENGAYNGWSDGRAPTVISLRVGVRGQPLP